MAIELQRYIAQTTPGTETPSYELATAGVRAQQQVVGAVTEFAVKARIAENDAQTAKTLQQNENELREFLDQPRWKQPTIDGRPTEDVMREEYDALLREQGTRQTGVVGPRATANLNLQQRDLESRYAAQMRAQGRQVRSGRIENARLTAVEEAKRGGRYDDAQRLLDDGYANGELSPERYRVVSEQTQAEKRLSPYAGATSLMPTETLLELRGVAEADSALGEDERAKVTNNLTKLASESEALAQQRIEKRWRANSPQFWIDMPKMSLTDIRDADASPEDKEQAIRLRQANTGSGGTDKWTDHRGLVSVIDRYAMGELNFEDASKEVMLLRSRQEIGAVGAIDAMGQLSKMRNELFQDTSYSSLRASGEREILRGEAENLDTIVAMFNEEQKNKLLTISSDFQRDFLDAKMKGGRAFDAQKWYGENIQLYRDKANALFVEAGKAVSVTGDANERAMTGLLQKHTKGDRFDLDAAQDEIENMPGLTDAQRAQMMERTQKYAFSRSREGG